MTRLKVAELTSGVGALVLGVGLGALFPQWFAQALPLLIDMDSACIDRPGTSHPTRYAYPEDAAAQEIRFGGTRLATAAVSSV